MTHCGDMTFWTSFDDSPRAWGVTVQQVAQHLLNNRPFIGQSRQTLASLLHGATNSSPTIAGSELSCRQTSNADSWRKLLDVS